MENPIKIGDLGVPLFLETPILQSAKIFPSSSYYTSTAFIPHLKRSKKVSESCNFSITLVDIEVPKIRIAYQQHHLRRGLNVIRSYKDYDLPVMALNDKNLWPKLSSCLRLFEWLSTIDNKHINSLGSGRSKSENGDYTQYLFHIISYYMLPVLL